jgi:hypothetical protein
VVFEVQNHMNASVCCNQLCCNMPLHSQMLHAPHTLCTLNKKCVRFVVG